MFFSIINYIGTLIFHITYSTHGSRFMYMQFGKQICLTVGLQSPNVGIGVGHAGANLAVLQRVGAELHRPKRHVPVHGGEARDARRPLRHVPSVRRQHLCVRAFWTFEFFAGGYLEIEICNL